WFSLIPFVKKYATEEYIHVITAMFVGLLCITIAIVMGIKLKKIKKAEIPDSRFNFRNVIELLSEMIFSLTSEIMGGHNARKFFPALASIFLFIFFNNLIGLIPGFLPPTDNINTTFACGVFIFIYYNYVGFKEHGVGYIKHFLGPILWLAPLMFPIELISNAVRPLSLGLRLFGNMTGDHMVLSIFSDLVPIGVPVVFMALGLFICFFQAFIFTILSTIYLTLALSDDH
ncbi:MAG: F0F1 ATP synthase subunit A, partial [Proteobacteria bacterium]|nr:F0F1 ATP synthase subunit A [Pseudomonadota bacterium]